MTLAETAHRAAVRFHPTPATHASLGRCMVLQSIKSRDQGDAQAANERLAKAEHQLEEGQRLSQKYGQRSDLDLIERYLDFLEKVATNHAPPRNPGVDLKPLASEGKVWPASRYCATAGRCQATGGKGESESRPGHTTPTRQAVEEGSATALGGPAARLPSRGRTQAGLKFLSDPTYPNPRTPR